MGDRGNIVMRYGSGEKGVTPKDIYFYTHWRGSAIPTILRTALAKNWRWNDDNYLARIIFCELVKGYLDDETGFGISPHVTDNEHDYLRVDLDAQRVQRVNPDSGRIKHSWSFNEYIALDLDTAKDLKNF